MLFSRKRRRNLVDGIELDDPCLTETRRLLQNLYRQQKSGPLEMRSYIVTSAMRGEGKSTLAALMAIVSARIFHKRTLIVDGDLHRPTLHTLLGISRGPGLFEAMRGTLSVAEVTRSTPLPLLFAMSSGYPREAAGQWYDDGGFARFLQQVRSQYDVIFVDAPPTVPAVEPVLMAEHVDSIVMVAMIGRTPIAMARRAKQLLAPVGHKIAGLVLNNAADGLPYYFNYRYYGYDRPHHPRRLTRIDKLPPPQAPSPGNAKNVGRGA